jgi:Tol biopolymer transport system component
MRMRTLFATLAGIVALVALTSVSAGASPRGVNGQIAYDRADPAGDDRFVYTANPDGSHEQQLVPGHTCCPSWSHSGSKLAIPYLTDDGRVGAAIVNADGSGYTPLPIDDPTLNLGCEPWSPDDARLACGSWDESNPARNGIFTMSSSDGSGLTRLTTNALGGADGPGAYSPDGTRLVFLRLDQDGNGVGLFVVRIKDGRLRRITPPGTLIQDGNFGDWSPQGNEIIFSRHVTADVRGSIWVVHADGSGLHEIKIQGLACGGSVFGFGCHAVHWSPDGKKIIFAANSPAGANIYTANADGTGLVQVTHDGGDDDPSWGTHPPLG